MALELVINESRLRQARYVTWAPSPCVLRVTGTSGAALGGKVKDSNRRVAGGGRIVFYRNPGDPPSTGLKLDVPVAGGAVRFWAGRQVRQPEQPGPGYLDSCSVDRAARRSSRYPSWSGSEKREQVNGWGARLFHGRSRLTDQGSGPFRFFRDMHVLAAIDEAHGNQGFLPWHRAYLMDLERELQAIRRQRCPALLAIRPTRASHFHARFHGRAKLGRNSSVLLHEPVAVLGDRQRAGRFAHAALSIQQPKARPTDPTRFFRRRQLSHSGSRPAARMEGSAGRWKATLTVKHTCRSAG